MLPIVAGEDSEEAAPEVASPLEAPAAKETSPKKTARRAEGDVVAAEAEETTAGTVPDT